MLHGQKNIKFSCIINICKAYYMYIEPREEEEVQGAYTFRNKRDLKY
jgi:hypothetical protein